MSLTIQRSIDVESAIQASLSNYMAAYCSPLPASFDIPCVLIQATGGSSELTASGIGTIDTFMVVIDARAETEDEALTCLRNAVAVLERAKADGVSYVETNSLYSWGADPVRPELALCSATLMVTARRETKTIDEL